MQISYQVFHDECLFVQKFTGVFLLERYLQYNQFIGEILRTTNKVLIDFRMLQIGESETKLPVGFEEQMEQVIKQRKKVESSELKGRKATIVIWVDKPLPTVIAHLFIKNFEGQNYYYCSSAQKVKKLLKLPKEVDVDAISFNLSESFNS